MQYTVCIYIYNNIYIYTYRYRSSHPFPSGAFLIPHKTMAIQSRTNHPGHSGQLLGALSHLIQIARMFHLAGS